jgi:NADH:ubiquinone oxidoreductase subunit K
MIRLIKGLLSVGIIINAVNLAMNGVMGATNERTLSNFMWFLVAYVIVDIIKDGMDNVNGGSV